MSQLSYSSFTPEPSKFVNHGILGCPTHGYTAIATTNDGNTRQQCLKCGWAHTHTPTHTDAFSVVGTCFNVNPAFSSTAQLLQCSKNENYYVARPVYLPEYTDANVKEVSATNWMNGVVEFDGTLWKLQPQASKK